MDTLILGLLLFIAALTIYQLYTTKRPFAARTKQQPVFVDTSVLIDGRIIAVAKSGFLTSPLYIPRSVIGELQLLADGGDNDKRSRARHGLDVVKQLQSMKQISVTLFQDGESAPEGVDNRLLSLAKQHKGSICTIDYNLNKVAQVEAIKVVNVNDLAMSLRMAYLPGEKILLELTQKGNDSHQAIGHLPDGTMVVVEHASQYVGKTMEVEFIRSLQTAAGKMMFAKVTRHLAEDQPKKKQDQSKGRALPKNNDKVATVKKQPSKQSQPRQRRRPQTNEERLVELANQ